MAYPQDGRQLSIFEFFYAVRDGDVENVRRQLQDGEVEASTPLVPRCFPPSGARRPPGQEVLDQKRGRGIAQRGEFWPREGCEGEEGDCALHLAARLGDSAMVEVLRIMYDRCVVGFRRAKKNFVDPRRHLGSRLQSDAIS